MTGSAVSSSTIDQVLSIIELHGGWARFACRTSVLHPIDFEASGTAMLARSTQACAGPGSEPDPKASCYHWQGCYVSLVEGYRTLHAFLDACSECPASTRALYQALEGYAGLLAAEIASGCEV